MHRRSRQTFLLALMTLMLVAVGCQSWRSSAYRDPAIRSIPVAPYDRVGPYAIGIVPDRTILGQTIDSTASGDSVICYLLARYQPRLNTDTTGPVPILEIDSLWLQVRDTTVYPEVSILQDSLVHLQDNTVRGRVFAVSKAGLPESDSLPLILKYVASVRDGATGEVLATDRFRHMIARNGEGWWAALAGNYPSPFSPTTSITYSIPVASNVKITIYNVLGEAVRTIVDKWHEPGAYEINWDAHDDDGFSLDSGIYFYRVEAGEFTETKKMVLLK